MTEPRFRLYILEDGKPQRIAEADDPAGVGLALVTLGNEARENGEPCRTVGVLDSWSHRWLTSLWVGREHTPFH